MSETSYILKQRKIKRKKKVISRAERVGKKKKVFKLFPLSIRNSIKQQLLKEVFIYLTLSAYIAIIEPVCFYAGLYGHRHGLV